MTLTARPYQLKAESDIRDAYAAGHRSVMLTSPVASGKTVIFSRITAGACAKGKRVLILAHRKELVFQVSDKLKVMGVPHGTILGGQPGIPRKQAIAGSVQTVLKRLRHLQPPDLIIADEAHRAVEDSAFGKIIEHFPSARVLGVSASPQRTDRRPLSGIFDTLVHGPSVAELVALGYLPPPEVYAPVRPDLSGVHVRRGDFVTSESEAAMNKPVITGCAVEHYKRLAYGKRAIVFCVSVRHAERVAEEFTAAGFQAAHVDGTMSDWTRRQRLKDFEAGTVPILTSVDLANEGLDIPGIEAAILLRPTQSVIVHVQQMGRAMRAAPGKDRAIIIDAAGNVFRHGLPDEAREWSLDGEERAAKESVPRVLTCQRCFAAYACAPCPRCGWVNDVKPRVVKQVEGELEMVSGAGEYDTPATGNALKDLEKQYAILKRVGARRNQKNPNNWAFGIVSARLAAMLESERGGLTYDDLALRTIERDRVMTAMRNEGEVDTA
jgi:superfamily II DNA or RNA helicase